jgi:Fuc2NAc and GlcNAc transferase
MLDWELLLAAMVSTATLTYLFLSGTPGQRWLAQPTARGAHSKPMPSGGGIAMVIPYVSVIGYYLVTGTLTGREGLIYLGCLMVALTGLVDDIRNLGIRWRLPVQIVSALWVVYWAGELPPVQFGQWHVDFPVVIHILGVLAFIWLLNLYNFMDGIDGLAASEAGFVTLLSSLLVINSTAQAILPVAPILTAITLGFLLWNWPPARVFMGDVGSGFLGYAIAALAIVSIADGSLNPWSWLLLLGVFVVDATYTLLYRLIDRQRWFDAHNTHAYQQAARLLDSHQKVTLWVMVVNVVWLAPLAWLATRNPELGLYLVSLGYLPLVILARKLRAGQPGHEGLETT